MNCEAYESSIIAYALGELTAEDAERCRAHLAVCEHCRAIYETYVGLTDAMEREPVLCPTYSESQALFRALNEAEWSAKPVSEPVKGLPALVLGSLAAFMVLASVLTLQVLGCFSLGNVARAIGPAPIAIVVVIILFVTSFLPIAVAARRKPLNGMTFRR